MITRLDYVPSTQILDSYVPLPFQEMREAIQNKQLANDQQQEKLEAATDPLFKIKVHKENQDIYGNVLGANREYLEVEDKRNQFEQVKQNIFDKYKGDFTNPDAKKEISNLARGIADWTNNRGQQIQSNTLNYIDTHKAAQQYLKDSPSSDFQNNAFRANEAIHEFHEGSSRELTNPGLGKYRDLAKEFDDSFKNVASQVLSRNASGQYVENGKRYNTIEEYLEGVSPQRLNQLYESYWKQNLEPIYTQQFIDQNRLGIKGGKVGEKQFKNYLNSQKENWRQQALKFASSKGKLNLSSSGVSKFEYGLGDEAKAQANTYGIVQDPVTDISKDYLNPSNVKNMSIDDYITAQGGKVLTPYAANNKDIVDFDEIVLPNGEKIRRYKDSALSKLRNDPKIKEENKKYENFKRQFDLLKEDKLSNTDWVKEFSKINPLAKKIVEQYPNINRKDLEKTYNNLVDIKSIYSNSKRLSTENKEAIKQNLIGNRKDMNFQGYINNTSLTDESGQQLNFYNIPLPEKAGFWSGTPTIGEVIEKGDPKELKALYNSIDVGTDIAGGKSIGGDYIKINGRKYMTGGVTPSQKAILAPYNILNEPVRKITTGQTESKELPVTQDIILAQFAQAHGLNDLKNIIAVNKIDVSNPEEPVISLYRKSGNSLKPVNIKLSYKDYLETVQELYDNNSPYITTKREEDKGKFSFNEDLEPRSQDEE